MNNNDDKKKKKKSKLKKKILKWLAPLIPYILIGALVLVIIFGVTAAILGPVNMAKEMVDNAIESIDDFFESMGNFLSGNGWNTNEQAFWSILDEGDLSCEKSSLVTSTIMFYWQNNPDKALDYGEKMAEEAEDAESAEDLEDTAEEVVDDLPYGQMLPDVEILVKEIKKGLNHYEDYVKNTFLRQYPYNEMLKSTGDKTEDEMAEDIYNDIKNISATVQCKTGGNYNGATCSFEVEDGTSVELKVRLLRCGNLDNNYSPIEETELIDLEKYITGVVYLENGNGPLEALKVQAVAARSFTLTRGQGMPDPIGTIEQIDGQWVVSIRNCVSDQVYCDPDEGCWSNNSNGGQWNSSTGVDSTIYMGENSSKAWSMPPLPEDSPIRQAVQETAGEILINSDGDMINTPYVSTTQNTWNNLANNGSDYFEILLSSYPSGTDIASNCTLVNGSSSGTFANWKQYDPNWANVTLGSSTIRDIGCAATSVAIQIASSGTETSIEDFDPGKFVTEYANMGGFDSTGNISWDNVYKIAPNFKHIGTIILSGSKEEKANQLREEINKGNRYMIMSVKPDDNHWVAVNYVDNDNIYIFDPGSESTSLWPKYTTEMENRVIVYEKTD